MFALCCDWLLTFTIVNSVVFFYVIWCFTFVFVLYVLRCCLLFLCMFCCFVIDVAVLICVL